MKESYKRFLERQNYDPLDPTKQHEAKSSEELMTTFLNNKIKKGLSLTSKAYIKWCEIAGLRAASHTMAVWVNDESDPKKPELIIYLDNSSLIADYTTNTELYKERLSYADFPVTSLKFKLSRKVGKNKPQQEVKTQDKKIELPNLTQPEEEEIELLCKTLPNTLKDKVSKAMELSFKVSKLENTRN